MLSISTKILTIQWKVSFKAFLCADNSSSAASLCQRDVRCILHSRKDHVFLRKDPKQSENTQPDDPG